MGDGGLGSEASIRDTTPPYRAGAREVVFFAAGTWDSYFAGVFPMGCVPVG
jgi:hypothetical protein